MSRWLPLTLLASALSGVLFAAEPPSTSTPPPATARPSLGGGPTRTTPTPGAVAPSSLADVARENRARKEKPATRSLGVIDNESLRKAGASPVRTPTPGRGRSAPSSPGTAPAFVPTDNDGRTEEYWRGRARSTRIRVEGAENEARRLEAETRRLENDFYAWSDGNYRDQVIKPAWDKAREDLKKARAEVDAAKATEDGLAEEARKAGAPPGWVR
ncbi:MAG: hypothetical protein EDX89_10585 [Acidobacteria bacterium]|nr:MAG: hypothetical protein EDX89_10585 [Acidobacteriota bacterium]